MLVLRSTSLFAFHCNILIKKQMLLYQEIATDVIFNYFFLSMINWIKD